MAGGGELRLSVITTNDSSGAKQAAADMAAAAKEVERSVQAQASAAEKAAKQQADEVEKAAERQAKAHEDMSKRITQASAVFTLGFAVAGAAAVNMAAGFEQSMDQVGAVAGASEAEIKKLSAAALQIGADTSFGAKDAAAAMEELAAGGRSVAQIYGGEALAAVNLAEAGNYGLADSARTIATVMDVWKNSQLATNDVVNRLAGAANASRFGVEDMSGAIAQAGGVAASMGVSFDDFTTAIAMTASSFASGSDAGTSYKTMILQLDGSTEKAKATISELGLEFRDSNGIIKGTAEIAEELATKVGVLGEAQQVAALKTIFGNDAYRMAAGLMDGAAESATRVNDVLANTDAADIAAQRMSNARGSIEELKGSAETLAISLGTHAVPALTAAADAGVVAVNAFGGLPESTQGLALGFTAIAVAAPAAVAGISKAVSMMSLLAGGAGSAQLKVGALALGVGALAVGLDVLLAKSTGHGLMERVFGDVSRADAASEAMRKFDGAIAETEPGTERMAAITERLARELGRFESQAVEAGNEVGSLGQAIGGADGRFFGFNVGLSDGVDKFKEYEESVRAAGAAMVENGATTAELHAQYLKLPPALREVFDEATNLGERLGEVGTAMGETLGGSLGSIGQTVGDVAGHFGTLVEVTPGVTVVMGEFGAMVAATNGDLDDLNDVMERINGTIASANPEVIALSASNAILQESIDDITGSGAELTETQALLVESMEAQIEANNQTIASHQSNQTAMEGVQGHLQLLMGEAGYAGLAAAMVDTGRESESMVDVTSSVREAFGLLASGDLPAAEEAFLSLKGELTPEEWGAIANAIGVRFPEQVKEGFLAGEDGIRQGGVSLGAAAESGLWSMEDNIFLAGQGLGESAGLGFAQGIGNVTATAVTAAGNLVASAIERARLVQQTESPSKVYRALGVSAGEGYAQGLAASEPLVREASAQMVGEGVEGAREMSGNYSIPIPVGRDGFGVQVGGGSELAQLRMLLDSLTPDARALWMSNPENREYLEWLARREWMESQAGAGAGAYGNDDIAKPVAPAAPPVINVEHPLPPPPKPRETTTPTGPGNHPIVTGPGGSMQPGDGTRTADGRVYWDGTGTEPSEPWVGYGALLGASGAGKQPGLLPLIPMGPNVAWDPNTGTYITTGLQPVESGSNVGWDVSGGTGFGIIDPVKANYGYSVYQDSAGIWRDIVTNEEAIGADGRFLNSRYQQDSLGWLGRLQNDEAKFGQRGLQAAAPVKQGAMGEFLKKVGMNRDNLGDRAGAINDFDWFTTKEDWAALGYGPDSEWTSDPWFGFVPKEFLRSQEGAEYLGLRGIDPLNNSAVRDDYNPWHPNANSGRMTAAGQADRERRLSGGHQKEARDRQIIINVQAMDAASFLKVAPQIREALAAEERRGY